MEKIIKIFETEIKSIDENAHTITALVSSKKEDRYGDIVLPESFKKRLKYYKDHPVLLSSHTYGDLRKQIGEATKVSITDEGLEASFKYYVGLGNPEADWGWVLAQKGIAGFSIGFMGHAYEDIKNPEGTYTIGRKFTDIELVEISQVLVPANRQSLQKGIEQNAEESRLMEMAIKSFEKGDLKDNAPIDNKSATEGKIDEKQHYTAGLPERGVEEPITLSKEEFADIIKTAVNQ